MEGALHMNELEVKHEDAYDPAVHASERLNVRILQHTFDVSCVNFNDQVSDT